MIIEQSRSTPGEESLSGLGKIFYAAECGDQGALRFAMDHSAILMSDTETARIYGERLYSEYADITGVLFLIEDALLKGVYSEAYEWVLRAQTLDSVSLRNFLVTRMGDFFSEYRELVGVSSLGGSLFRRSDAREITEFIFDPDVLPFLRMGFRAYLDLDTHLWDALPSETHTTWRAFAQWLEYGRSENLIDEAGDHIGPFTHIDQRTALRTLALDTGGIFHQGVGEYWKEIGILFQEKKYLELAEYFDALQGESRLTSLLSKDQKSFIDKNTLPTELEVALYEEYQAFFQTLGKYATDMDLAYLYDQAGSFFRRFFPNSECIPLIESLRATLSLEHNNILQGHFSGGMH